MTSGQALSDLTIVTGDTGDLVYLVSGGNSRAAQLGNLLALVDLTGSVQQFASIELGDTSDTTLTRDTGGVVAVEGEPLAFRDPSANLQNSTAYTLALTDVGGIVIMDTGVGNVVSIPPNSSVPLPVPCVINVVQRNSGTTTIDADTGVTLNGVSGGTGNIQNRFQGVSLLQLETDDWIASGDIGTVT